jgi:hypothetical protein
MTGQTQAEHDAHAAWTYAINLVMAEGRAPRTGRTAEQVVDDYATDLADQLDGDRGRL